MREKANSAALTATVRLTDPMVAQRMATGGQGLARAIGDPALRRAEGVASLAQAATREANVLAYDDTFRLVALLAAATALYLLFLIGRRACRARRMPA